MIVRVTGSVTQVGTREGNSKASGKPYSIPFIEVQSSPFVINELNVPDSLVGEYTVGELVDLIVGVEVSRGGFLSARVNGAWPADSLAPSY